MEPPNKHSRGNEEPAISHSFPDLSTLPEPVLVHILSFMDIKEAVQTCILSKPWRKLWTLIPSLNLVNFLFNGTDGSFVRFVTSMLYFRGASKLHTFSLRWLASKHVADWPDYENCQIHVGVTTSWIYSVLTCKPLVISLELIKFDYFKLPDALFTCASLEQLELKLSHCMNANNEEALGPKYVNLPNLKKLILSDVTLNGPVMQGILSGCPLLKELSLSSCILEFSEIKSDLLSRLTVIRCRGSRVVEIIMPSLISLHLEDHCMEKTKISLKNTPSLVKVFVFYDSYHEKCSCRAEFEFFKCLTLTTVTDLEFYGSGVKDLVEKILPNCPIFHNLKQLTFGQWGTNEKLDVLCWLLQHTPNLEKLTIVDKKVECSRKAKGKGAKEKGATSQIQIPFRCEQLKAIEVKYSDPSGVHDPVDVLLRNTSLGEKLRINYSRC